MTSRPIAVEGLYGEAGELKDCLTYRLAGDGTGMDGYASNHVGPIDDSDALARLRSSDSALLASRTTADHNKVIFGYDHLDAFDLRTSTIAPFWRGTWLPAELTLLL